MVHIPSQGWLYIKKSSCFLTNANEHVSFHQLQYSINFLKRYLTQKCFKHPLYRYLRILGNEEIYIKHQALDPGVSPRCQWGAGTGWDFPTRIGECHDQRHDTFQGTVWRPVVGTNNESQGVSSLCAGFYFCWPKPNLGSWVVFGFLWVCFFLSNASLNPSHVTCPTLHFISSLVSLMISKVLIRLSYNVPSDYFLLQLFLFLKCTNWYFRLWWFLIPASLVMVKEPILQLSRNDERGIFGTRVTWRYEWSCLCFKQIGFFESRRFFFEQFEHGF